MLLTDKSTMPFGKHIGKTMEEVPADWLKWYYETQNGHRPADETKAAVYDYCVENLDVIEKELKETPSWRK